MTQFCYHVFPPHWSWVRKRQCQCCWATVPQTNTRPLEVQTAKVQLSCWCTLEQPHPSTPRSLSLSLPLWWLMANAALAHLYIPSHPSLANRCEILDMAWIWLPGEKKGKKRLWWDAGGYRLLRHCVPEWKWSEASVVGDLFLSKNNHLKKLPKGGDAQIPAVKTCGNVGLLYPL